MLRPLPPFQTDSKAFLTLCVPFPSIHSLYLYGLYAPRWNVSDCMVETNFLDSKYPTSLGGMTTTGDVVMASDDAFLISEGEIGAPQGLGPFHSPHVLTLDSYGDT